MEQFVTKFAQEIIKKLLQIPATLEFRIQKAALSTQSLSIINHKRALKKDNRDLVRGPIMILILCR